MNAEPNPTGAIAPRTFFQRWLFTKQGAPVLVAILSLLASVAFNVYQIVVINTQNERLKDARTVIDTQDRRLRNSLSRAGTFLSGQIMGDILAEINKYGPSEESPGEMRIVTDLAGYGLYSWPDELAKCLDALRRRSDQGQNIVNVILLTDERQREILRLQFAGFDTLKNTANGKKKIERFLRGKYGMQAARNLDLEAKILSVSELTLNEWVEIIVEADRLIVDDLDDWGVLVERYPQLWTVHLLSASPQSALLAVVDFQQAVNEIAFGATGEVASHLHNIYEIVHNGVQREMH